MKLSEYLIEAIAKRSTGKYGIGLTDCKTIGELIGLLDERTKRIDKPSRISATRIFGSDREYLEYIMARANGEVTAMVVQFGDGLKRPTEHYTIYIVHPEQKKGYLIDLYDIPLKGEKNEGKIKWNTKGGTGIVVWDLEKMIPVKGLSNYDGAKEKLEIIEMI
jgi:hypothetical protein